MKYLLFIAALPLALAGAAFVALMRSDTALLIMTILKKLG